MAPVFPRATSSGQSGQLNIQGMHSFFTPYLSQIYSFIVCTILPTLPRCRIMANCCRSLIDPGGVIAICVLCVVAGMCAIGVCAHYIWRSHKKDRERALSAKILLDRAMQRVSDVSWHGFCPSRLEI